jgi:hypothetical protein
MMPHVRCARAVHKGFVSDNDRFSRLIATIERTMIRALSSPR